MKIGLVSLPLAGHLNPYLAVARKLKTRGHQPVYFGPPDCEAACVKAGIEFVAHSEEAFPIGAVAKNWEPIAHLRGMELLEYAETHINPRLLAAALKHLPGALERSGVEAMIVDPVFFFAEIVPMSLHLPYVNLLSVVGPEPSGTTPPSLFAWPHETTPEARERNLKGMEQVGAYIAAAVPLAANFAARHNLSIDWKDPGALSSKLATISPMPAEFDFPDIPWPATFHYTGPMVDDAGRSPVKFDWKRIDKRPLIYASLGTLTNGILSIHKAILGAARRLNTHQFVFSVGNNIDPRDLGPVPENMLVIDSAPQLELLKRAALCITHAGINTVLESLAQGVPMVAIPVGYDQPGIAVRIAYHGVGEFLEIDQLTDQALHHLLERVLNTSSYRDRAEYFRDLLAGIDGLELAADIVEEALASKSKEIRGN